MEPNFIQHNNEGAQNLNTVSGAVVAVAGQNFVVFGCDTVVFEGDEMKDLYQSSKWFPITDSAYLGCIGNWNHIQDLRKCLLEEYTKYRRRACKEPSIETIVQILSNGMYAKHNYDIGCVLVGIDADGSSAIYKFDRLGSAERKNYMVAGWPPAERFINSILDHEVQNAPNRSFEWCCEAVVNAFKCAAKRYARVGGVLKMYAINSGGLQHLGCVELEL